MNYEAAIEAILQAIPDCLAVYLFGSRATGEERAGSDIDLAVLTPRGIAPVARWELQERLATLLHADVDLVDLRAASTVLRAQVVSAGTLLHELGPAQRALFEATVLSDYARLNEERRGILDDIRERGTIHG